MPYRIPESDATRAAAPGRAAHWDDLILGGLLLLLATPRVVIAIAGGERFTAEPTLAAIGVLLGMALVATGLWRRR